MSRILGRASPKFLVLAAALVCSAYFLLSGLSFKTAPFIASHDGPKPAQTTNDCSDLPGANSTLVVMKTGSTEIHEKLPIHLETTLRCYPNHMIFSDVNEQFQGEKIIDALEDIDTDIKDFHSDFKLYRRLREHGREALDPSELSDALNTPNSDSGKSQNEGWKLDKWKFLPMLRRVLEERPDMEWYIFVETDTFIFWKTLLAYLAALDSTKPYYMGAQINIGEVTFAQGGSAYAMSKPAVELVVNYYIEHKREWENFTDGHWAGDCVLSKFLQDAGGQLTHAWPIYQGDSIGNMNYDSVNNNYRLWCHPTVSYHHMTPAVIKDMWEFEQQTFFSSRTETREFLRHKDVFLEYILPRVSRSRKDWDNNNKNEEGTSMSLEDCRAACEKKDSCVQYSIDAHRKCLTTSRPNLGQASHDIDSGWIYERMKKVYDDAPPCGDESWIT